MAGRRQFETQFILNAVLNSGFKAALKEAQKEFLRLGEEIEKIKAIQKDISAYQSLQKAIDNTSAKLKYLEERQKHVNEQKVSLEKQIRETEADGKSTAELERKKAALEERETVLGESFRRTNDAMEAQKKKADALAGQLEKAGVNLDNLSEAGKKNVSELEHLKRAQERVAEGAKETGKTSAEAVETVAAALAAAGILNGLKTLADGFAECTRTAAEFDRAMSAVKAIAGASEREIDALNAEARRLGASTVFTAQQSAEAMNYMAMAGWNTREMMVGMSGVMNAAAASGEDLASVSDIITDSLTAFGLTAADAAHFSDILAQASARSNTNIGMMGQTFQRAAPVAAALGFTAEDTAVMIGLMANSGIKASRAGTALVNIFNGLLNGVTLTGEAFGEYEFSAIRADGTMKGLAGTVDELRGKFAQMSEAEKVMNAKEIAGLRGYSGLLAILNSTEEEYRSLQDEISSCAGAAERMAEIKLDNLSGDVTLMQSAFEGLKITVGEQFTPELRWGAKALTAMTGGVDRFVQKAPALVKGLSGAGAGFVAVAGAVTAANSAMKIFHALSGAGIFQGLSGGLLAASAAVGSLIGIAVRAQAEFRETVKAATELDEAVEKLNDTISETTVQDIQSDVLANAAAAEVYLARIEDLSRAQSRSADQEAAYQAALAGLLEAMPELSDCISQTADQYGRVTYALEGSTDAIRDNIEAMKQKALVAAYQDKLTEAYKAQTDTETKLQRAILDKTDAQEAYGKLLVQQEGLLEKLSMPGASRSQDREDLDKVTRQLDEYGRQIDEYDESIGSAQDDLKESERNVEAVIAAVNGVLEGMGIAGYGAREFAAGTDEAAGSAGNMAGTLDQVTVKARDLADEYRRVYDETLKAVQGQYNLWDEVKETTPANLDSVEKAMQGQLDNWTARNENVETLSGIVGDVSGLYTLLGVLANDMSQESANVLAGLAGLAENGETDKIREFAGVYVDLQEKQKKYAETTVDLLPQWEEAKGRMLQSIDEAVEGMDKSEESGAAGRAIIQAFMDEADDPSNLAQIRAAYARAANEAIHALNAQGGITQEFLIQIGAEHYTPPGYPPLTEEGFASGTDNAPPGWAWVGENGPELMRMHGGEQILPSRVSQDVAEHYNEYERYAAGNYELRATDVRESLREAERYHEYIQYAAGNYELYTPDVTGPPKTEKYYSGITRYADTQSVQQMPPVHPVLEVERPVDTGGGGTSNINVTFNVTISPGTPEETVDSFRAFMDSSEFRDRIAYIGRELNYDARRTALA